MGSTVRFRCTIFFLLLATKLFAQGGIQGQVTDATTKKPLIGTRVWLYVYVCDTSLANNPYHQDDVRNGLAKPGARDTIYQRIAHVFTDSSGNYEFKNLKPHIYKLAVFHKTAQEGRSQLGEFDEKKSIRVDCEVTVQNNFQLAVFCPFDKTKNLTNCPRCNKSDQVLKIRHGMLLVNPKTGNLLTEPGYYYSGYCDIPRCGASKRCMRCEHEF